MTITVAFFAGAAEAAGMDSTTMNPPDGGTVDALTTHLVADNPALDGVLGRCSVLLDGSRVDDPGQARLRDGSEVHYLPPFAGG